MSFAALAVISFWTVVAVHSVAWRYYLTRGRPGAPPLLFIVRAEVIMFGIAACLTPAVAVCVRRFPFGRGSWMRSCLVHVLTGVLFAVVVKLAWDFAMLPFYPVYWIAREFSWGRMFQSLFAGFQVNFLLYWILVAGLTAADAAHEYHLKATEASQLRAQLAEARLTALRSQLDPHFLFNTLHGISALVHKDPDAAETMLISLSDLLRHTLEHHDLATIPLARELELVGLYLDIQCTRFRERLCVRIDVSQEALSTMVPDMILQPLVENAVRHAIAERAHGGRIEVRGDRRDGFLLLDVEDFGGSPVQLPLHEGVGLSNTRERLATLFGPRAHLRLEPGLEGLRVQIAIPATVESAA